MLLPPPRRVEDAGLRAGTVMRSPVPVRKHGFGVRSKLLVMISLMGVEHVSGQTGACVDATVCSSLANHCGVANVRDRCPVVCDTCPTTVSPTASLSPSPPPISPGHPDIATRPVFISVGSTTTGNTAGSPSTAGTNAAGDHVYLINVSRRTVIDIVRDPPSHLHLVRPAAEGQPHVPGNRENPGPSPKDGQVQGCSCVEDACAGGPAWHDSWPFCHFPVINTLDARPLHSGWPSLPLHSSLLF